MPTLLGAVGTPPGRSTYLTFVMDLKSVTPKERSFGCSATLRYVNSGKGFSSPCVESPGLRSAARQAAVQKQDSAFTALVEPG